MADTNTTPKERIRIFDREGFPVAEFRTTVQRSWAIGEEGRAVFSYPSRKTDIVNEQVLQFGNWLWVQNDTLPDWVGMIDVPRHWTARTVNVCAYTPERQFALRRGPIEDVLTGSSGTIFERLLQYVNLEETTVLRAGNIYRGGTQRQETINPTTLDKDLKRIQQRSGEEYQFRPATDVAGRLIVYCDWLDRLGIDSPVLLHEGRGGGNIEATENIMIEDGPIINDTLGYGDGQTWKSKPTTKVIDPTSTGRYGLRQDSKGYSGVTTTQALIENSTSHIAQFKAPARSFEITALNVGETFQYINLGNRLKLRFQNIGFYNGTQGFETTVRILGMAYDPTEKNKVVLVVEEIS